VETVEPFLPNAEASLVTLSVLDTLNSLPTVTDGTPAAVPIRSSPSAPGAHEELEEGDAEDADQGAGSNAIVRAAKVDDHEPDENIFVNTPSIKIGHLPR
jgi:hypothetical protein